MKFVHAFAGLAALLLALLPAVAAPADKVVARPDGGPALIVPAASPVRLRGFDKDGVAHFSGRFVLTGTFIYGCRVECEAPVKIGDLQLMLVPDPDLAKRLPHWQDRGEGMVVDIGRFGTLRRTIASGPKLAEILSGNVEDVRGRISIVVDDFAADFGCDYSPYYSARFERLETPPELARIEVDGDFGCA